MSFCEFVGILWVNNVNYIFMCRDLDNIIVVNEEIFIFGIVSEVIVLVCNVISVMYWLKSLKRK